MDSAPVSNDVPPGPGPGFRTKADWAYLQLRQWIQAGVLSPGQRLDQEQLAHRLAVSRVPLRQALVRLGADGLVLNRPHAGATVAPLSLADAEDIYASRNVLEVMLTEVAVPKLTEETLFRLGHNLQQQQQALEGGRLDSLLIVDRQFHELMYQPSGYARSLELVGRLRDLSDRYVAAYHNHRERATASLTQHRALYEACVAGDSVAAANLVHGHVIEGIYVLRQIVDETPAAARELLQG